MVKTLLSLDLGVTTGWAVHTFSREVITFEECGIIQPDSVFTDALKHLVITRMPTHSVAERPVIFRGPLGTTLEERIGDTKVILDHQVKFINPSDWKDSRFKKHLVPRGATQHERDAIRIGVWYWDTELIGL